MQQLFAASTKRTLPKILALAKNYVPQGAKDVPDTPQVFTKPLSSILYRGEKLILETQAQVNWEIELGVMIGHGGKHIPKGKALDHVGGYFLCLDMTDWSMLSVARSTGLAWDIAKGQDGFLPISDFIPKSSIADPMNVQLQLNINNLEAVNASTSTMYFQVDQLIEYISKYMTLNEGDMILTGTPKLAPVQDGDHLSASLSYAGRKLAGIELDILRKVL